MTGHELIAAERLRQMHAEGFGPQHDDKYRNDELPRAAMAYLACAGHRTSQPSCFPFAKDWWKPTPDGDVRDLVKAGALIAAEIDRRRRLGPDKPADPKYPRHGSKARTHEAMMFGCICIDCQQMRVDFGGRPKETVT